jgi:hypothetical protein
MRRSRLSALAVATGLLLSAVAGCGGSSTGWKAPHKGQAALLVDYTDAASGGPGAGTWAHVHDGLGRLPRGAAADRSGDVYALGLGLVKVRPRSRTAVAVPGLPHQQDAPLGLVTLPDGSLVTGVGKHTVERIAPDGTATVLSSAFHDRPAPFGTRPDGTILVGDGPTVWALAPHKGAEPARLWHTDAKSRDAFPLDVLGSSAVDAHGTAYITPQVEGTSYTPLSQVTEIRVDGTTPRVALPSHVSGVSAPVDDLKVEWLTSDGASGVYAEVFVSDGPAAVLHLHGGHADLVAAEKPGTPSGSRCNAHRPFDASKVGCALPASLTYTHGTLYLTGGADYVMEIPVS